MKLVFFLLSFLICLNEVFSSSYSCDDEAECDGDTLDYTTVYCYGYLGCEDTDISSTYGYFYGYYSGYYTEASSEYSYADGLLALAHATLSSYESYVRGFFGAYYAEIEPYSSELYLYLYGYFSGYYADVLCYSGDTCYVYCGEVYGCDELSYYCYSGATCYYDCSDDSDYCPTLYSGVESEVLQLTEISNLKEHKNGLTDDEISNYRTINTNKKLENENNGNNNINWNDIPNGKQLEKEFNNAMKVLDVTRNKKQGNIFDTLMKSKIFTFAGGMLCMLLLGKLYSVYINRSKYVQTNDIEYSAVSTVSS